MKQQQRMDLVQDWMVNRKGTTELDGAWGAVGASRGVSGKDVAEPRAYKITKGQYWSLCPGNPGTVLELSKDGGHVST